MLMNTVQLIRSPKTIVPAALVTLAAVVLFFAAPAGCSNMNATQTNVAKLAVQYAVVKVVEKNPAYGPRVVVIAQEVRKAAGGETADTVDLVLTLVKAKIQWDKLDAADTLLVNALIDQVGIELKARLGDAKFDPDKLLVIAEVATWIEQAATLASPPQPK